MASSMHWLKTHEREVPPMGKEVPQTGFAQSRFALHQAMKRFGPLFLFFGGETSCIFLTAPFNLIFAFFACR